MQSTKLSYFPSFLVVLCFDFFIVQSFHDFVKLSLTTLDPGSLTLKHCGITRQTSNDFNNYDKADGTRDFITTQSVKKLKAHLKKWALAPEGWRLSGSDGRTIYNIDELDEGKCPDRIYCKSRWIREKVDVTMDGQIKKAELEQQLIATYSIKYRNYLCSIRNRQVERAGKAVEAGAKAVERKRQNDPKWFIRTDHVTEDGEAAGHAVCYIDEDAIREEEKYDGFYAVCTRLKDGPESIIKVNRRRWEIEECSQT